MNYQNGELIERLWNQAYVNGMLPFEQRKRFAELIVRECINCIENTDKGYIFTAKDAGIVNASHTRSMKKVKEHFGVEE